MDRALFAVIIFLLSPTYMYGQGKEMLIEQIAAKKIIREDFDKNGKLKGTQIFLMGELKRKDNIYEVDVVTELYDENMKQIRKYTTSYTCNPDEYDVLINVFPFTNPNKTEIKVNVTSNNFQRLYDLTEDGKLEDIHLKMSVESGVLNFLGSKSLVTIKSRQLEVENGEVKIISDAIIEAYILGLKFKTIDYSVEEHLSQSFTLKQQIFKNKDGSYFTMNYSTTM